MSQASYWQDRGDEKSDTQTFWLELLHDVLGIASPTRYIQFEKRVELGHISYIDAYIPSTGIIIEQKSRGIDLDAPARQSDGEMKTPFEQAKRYYDWLPASEKGRYIITCNFAELRIYDMETPKAPPRIITLEALTRDSLAFILKPERVLSPEVELSLQAGSLARKLRTELLKRYKPDDKHAIQSLNIFCVRIVFLLYAEDSGLFAKSQFHDYMKAHSASARQSLIELFRILDQKPEDRDPYIDADLQAFPYVNGGLFSGESIIIPQIDGEPLRIILEDMSEGFNWKGISPTIFGAVFESILHDEERHEGGMHYTSIENIHKVIDPLFMDELNSELDSLLSSLPSRERNRNLRTFQKKLASLKFFDPACGSGNFLTETYLSLRRLENRILAELAHGQQSFAFSEKETPVQVSISQFYGIEINDFAVSVARTALWIAEAQMWSETKSIVHVYEDILPLKSYSNIIEDNALSIQWRDIVKPAPKLYVIGNPPYMGYSGQTPEQKKEVMKICGRGKLDYVSCWYWKAAEFIAGTGARAAFLSTSSVTQGEQVSLVFKPLHTGLGILIDFAHQSFVWDSEAEEKAQVHVSVIGFDTCEKRTRRLYTSGGLIEAENINFYLVAADNVFAEARPDPMQADTPRARIGSIPRDGGYLIMTREEMEELIMLNPIAEKLLRPYMGARDFIARVPRYCLWLVDASPHDIARCPKVMERIKGVKAFRLESTRAATRKLAETPSLFAEARYSKENYIAIPEVSSAKRKYIPIDWLPPEVIPGHIYMIENASLYHFGVLTSRVHMAWMRRVSGRLRADYSYSNTVTYNTFVWPVPSVRQRARIESCAQMILDARAERPECSFGELYNDDIMPASLRRAHALNDAAVCGAYGWPKDIEEEEIVRRLFVMYGDMLGK